ncbi:MAG: hypothetical protein QM680_06140 [Luteolibacter sp.]
MKKNGNKIMKFPLARLSILALLLGTCRVCAQANPDLGELKNYPVSSRIWLGSLVGEVQVEPVIPIEINLNGSIEWKVEDRSMVAEDQVIAVSDAKKIELSAKSLELKRSQMKNSRMDIESSLLEKKQALQGTIQNLESKLAEMKLTETERQLLGENFVKRMAVERSELMGDIKRQREKFDSDYFETSQIQEQERLKLDLEKAENEHEELIKNSEILAEHAGRLEIFHRGDVRRATVVGQIVQVGQAEVALELLDPRVRSLPGQELQIGINGEDGRIYPGRYLRDSKERSMNRNGRICVFAIQPSKEGEPVPASLTGSRMAQVYRVLQQPGHILEKNQFLFKFSKEISEEGWASFVEKRWPDTRVVYVAPKVVVVNSRHEN